MSQSFLVFQNWFSDMKKWLFGFSILLFFQTYAQKSHYRYSQVGLIAGVGNYSGDLTPNYANPLNIFREMRPELGVGLYRAFSPIVLMGLETTYKNLYANEGNHRNVAKPRIFTSHLVQANLVGEIISRKFGKHFYKTRWAPYAKFGAGLGVVSPTIADPSSFEAPFIELYDKSYFFLKYFAGGGIKLRTKYKYSISLEAVLHLTNIDYIDGFLDTRLKSFNDVYGGFRVIVSKYYFGKHLNIK